MHIVEGGIHPTSSAHHALCANAEFGDTDHVSAYFYVLRLDCQFRFVRNGSRRGGLFGEYGQKVLGEDVRGPTSHKICYVSFSLDYGLTGCVCL